jgi:hypothetical protein
VDAIILVQASLQGDSREEEIHIGKIIFLRELREYRFIRSTVFSTEIEWRFHPCEKDGDFFGLDLLYDRS